MLSRFSPALVAFGGSVLLLAGLIGALYWISRPNYTADAAERTKATFIKPKRRSSSAT